MKKKQKKMDLIAKQLQVHLPIRSIVNCVQMECESNQPE
jgi:hypothetical protein